MAELLFDYNIKKITNILLEDRSLRNKFSKYSVDVNKIFIKEISIILIRENDFISNNPVEEVILNDELKSSLNDISIKYFDEEIFIDDLLYQLIYSYKYSRVKNFFFDNYPKFLIPLDYEYISNNKKQKIFFESLMKEFDKFSDIISSMENLYDSDKVDGDLLYYLLSLFGYDKIEDEFLNIHTLRELTKNILEIYRIKGTSYSFELFFNFLGFNVEMDEFWFDKRFHSKFSNIIQNPYTGSSDENNIKYYLTPINPIDSYEDLSSNYKIRKNELTDIRNVDWFKENIQEGYTPLQIIDEEESDLPDYRKFTYFKTNIINYKIRNVIENDESLGLSSELYEAVLSYANFLVPIFIKKMVTYDTGIFSDKIKKFLKEKMFYSGIINDTLHNDKKSQHTKININYKLFDNINNLENYQLNIFNENLKFGGVPRFAVSDDYSLGFDYVNNFSINHVFKKSSLLNDFFNIITEKKEIFAESFQFNEDGVLIKISEDNTYKVLEN